MEREKIEILCIVGFGDRTRTQIETAELFNEIYPYRPPICQKVVSGKVVKFRVFSHVRDLPKCGRSTQDENEQLEVLFSLHDNPYTPLADWGQFTHAEICCSLNSSKAQISSIPVPVPSNYSCASAILR